MGLRGAPPTWRAQQLHEVDLNQFEAAQAAGGFVVDVRQPHEYEEGHVPGAYLIPLAQVTVRLSEIPTDQTVYVICASGVRSLTAASTMVAAVRNACSVAGGTVGWARRGLPLVTGADRHST